MQRNKIIQQYGSQFDIALFTCYAQLDAGGNGKRMSINYFAKYLNFQIIFTSLISIAA